MGFNDWNSFGCNVDAQLIEQTADEFVSSGLKDAGYEYVNIDDCWMTARAGPADRSPRPGPRQVPRRDQGALRTTYTRKGLKLGIYEERR